MRHLKITHRLLDRSSRGGEGCGCAVRKRRFEFRELWLGWRGRLPKASRGRATHANIFEAKVSQRTAVPNHRRTDGRPSPAAAQRARGDRVFLGRVLTLAGLDAMPKESHHLVHGPMRVVVAGRLAGCSGSGEGAARGAGDATMLIRHGRNPMSAASRRRMRVGRDGLVACDDGGGSGPPSRTDWIWVPHCAPARPVRSWGPKRRGFVLRVAAGIRAPHPRRRAGQ